MNEKNLYIIAGCNGAGKTTASFTILPEILECKEFVNADEIAKGLSPFQPEKVAFEAGRIMLNRILISSETAPQTALYRLRNNINVTEELCLEAVKQIWWTLQYVPEHLKTEHICLEAVKQYGYSLRFIKEQTPLIIHYLKKYNITIYEIYKKENRITIPDNEMKKFYNENPHLLLTL